MPYRESSGHDIDCETPSHLLALSNHQIVLSEDSKSEWRLKHNLLIGDIEVGHRYIRGQRETAFYEAEAMEWRRFMLSSISSSTLYTANHPFPALIRDETPSDPLSHRLAAKWTET